MAGVGAETAYATEIAVVQRVYYDQIFSFGCTSTQGSYYISGANNELSSMDANHVNSTHWFLYWWHNAAVPRLTSFHE